MARTILATQDDLWQLAQLIECALRFQPRSHQHLAELKEELNTARVVAQEEMPSDIVTMNSGVRMRDLDSGHEGVNKVVFHATRMFWTIASQFWRHSELPCWAVGRARSLN